MLSVYIYHLILITIMIMLLLTYFLICLVVEIRLISNYNSKQKLIFLNKWETLLFSYMEDGILPNEIVSKIPRRKYKYLLDYIGQFLLTIKGEEFDRLALLITSTKLSEYLLKKLKSNNKKNIIFSSFYIGIAKIEEAKPILQQKIKGRNEQIFFSCSLALAKINSYDSLELILTEFERFSQRYYGYLLLILTEFDEKICNQIIKLMKTELPEPLIVTFIRVLRYYKYQTAGSTVLTILVYTYSKEILIECLKFIEETKYKNAIPAVSRFLEHNKPEIRSQAIRTIMRLDSEGFEDKVHSKLFDNNYEVRYQAAFSILNYCDDGEEKLSELAYDLQNNNAAAVSRMLISEKKVKEG